MIQTHQELGDYLTLSLAKEAESFEIAHGELTLHTTPAHLLRVMAFLHDDGHCLFKQLVDITAVDTPGRAARFDVVYHLLSLKHNQRIRVKAPVAEGTTIPSVVSIFAAAGWFEREAWDMYGVLFSGNPDLRRILTDYGFDGHPLRKDFPLTGFVEVRYDEEEKRVIYEPVQLAQAFRSFDFESPWEGGYYAEPVDRKTG